MHGRIGDNHVDLAVFTLYVIGDRPQSTDITNLRRHGLSATLVIPHLSNPQGRSPGSAGVAVDV